MRKYKQSDTSKVIYFYMVDSTDHVSEVTGLTVTVTVSKNGGSFGAVSGSVAEVGNGLYKLTPTSADVGTLGPVVFRATATGADPCVVEGIVVAYDPYSAADMGLSSLTAVWNAGKILTNKADRNETTGVITYYDDDGTTPILTITPSSDGGVLTRTPS